MKVIVLLFSMFAMTSYASEATLELKSEGYYYKAHREIKIKLPQLNNKLKKMGLEEIPEVVVLSDKDPEAYATRLANVVDAANKKLDREMHFNFLNQGYGETYIYKMTLCYRGDIKGIPDLIEKLRGNFLHEEEGILAIGAGTKKKIIDEAFKSKKGLKERFQEEYDSNLENINKWLNYDSKSSTALVMSDYGAQGDGTELEATEIPACK